MVRKDNQQFLGDLIRLPGEIVGGIADIIEEEIDDLFN